MLWRYHWYKHATAGPFSGRLHEGWLTVRGGDDDGIDRYCVLAWPRQLQLFASPSEPAPVRTLPCGTAVALRADHDPLAFAVVGGGADGMFRAANASQVTVCLSCAHFTHARISFICAFHFSHVIVEPSSGTV